MNGATKQINVNSGQLDGSKENEKEKRILRLREKIFLEENINLSVSDSEEKKTGIHICKMPKGCRPVITVFGQTIPEVWENSLLATYLYGTDVKTEYDKTEDPPSKDCRMTMVVNDSFKEPRIHRSFPDALGRLEFYRQEVIEGIHNHWIEPKVGKWTYTYNIRLYAYRVTDDLEELDSAFVKMNSRRRALREFYRNIVKKPTEFENYKISSATYEFLDKLEECITKKDEEKLENKLEKLYVKYSYRFREGISKEGFVKNILEIIEKKSTEELVVIPPVNQIDYIIDKLSKSTYSRRAQGITWIPTADPKTDDPPCLQRVWCRMFPDENGQQVLNIDIDWRSRDAYNAAFENIFALTELQKQIAEGISEKIHEPVKIGPYVDYSNSYHIYGYNLEDFENRFIKAVLERKFEDRVWDTEFALPFFEEEKEKLKKDPDYPLKGDGT